MNLFSGILQLKGHLIQSSQEVSTMEASLYLTSTQWNPHTSFSLLHQVVLKLRKRFACPSQIITLSTGSLLGQF